MAVDQIYEPGASVFDSESKKVFSYKTTLHIDIISCFAFKLNSSNQSIQTIFELYIFFFSLLDFKGTVTLKWTFIPQNISGASQQNNIAAFLITTENNHWMAPYSSSSMIQSLWKSRDPKLIWEDVIYPPDTWLSWCTHFRRFEQLQWRFRL